MSSNNDFEIENGVLVKYTGAGGDVVIPDGVTSIGNGAFSGCQNIKIAVSDEKYFVVDDYKESGKDVVAARKILQTGKLDPEVKIPLGLKLTGTTTQKLRRM